MHQKKVNCKIILSPERPVDWLFSDSAEIFSKLTYSKAGILKLGLEVTNIYTKSY